MLKTNIHLNAFDLKLIAIAAMLCDHVGAVLFPHVLVLRVIGRLTMPVMTFFIAEGYAHTSNVRAYLIRLSAFAFLSEIPFDLAMFGKPFQWEYQNIFFTLALGLLAIYLSDTKRGQWLGAAAPFLCAALSELIRADYGSVGVLAIYGYHLLRKKTWGTFAVTAAGAAVLVLPNVAALLMMHDVKSIQIAWGLAQLFSILAVIPLSLYDGQRGPRIKYFFYLFYPLHLFALYLIQRLSG